MSAITTETSTSAITADSTATSSLWCPIFYGSSAVAIKKPENDHTHRWTVFLRGFNNEDISTYVRKVVFKLHESFLQPTRVIEKFPFEVSETGWGEFQIQIKVFFHEAPDRPITLLHNLKLYEAGEDLDAQIKNGCRAVVAEHYDEIVFDPPPPSLVPILQSSSHAPQKSSLAHRKLLEREAEELEKLNQVLKTIESEISALKPT